MRLLIGLVRFGIGFGAVGLSLLALLALLGFAVPALDLLNHAQMLLFAALPIALVLVLLLFRGRRKGWLAGLAGAGLLASAVTFVPEALSGLAARPPPPAAGQQVLKLMTHNLFGMNDEMERVAAIVEDEDPDFIVLQEYFPKQSAELHPMLRERYPHFARCRGGKRANLGFYAKQPFALAPGSSCPDDAFGVQRTARVAGSFVLADGALLTVMTTHLDWPVPMGRQAAQFTELRAAVEAVEGALILAGDFNSTPWSYALRRFEERAGLDRHTHNLVTFPNRFMIRRIHETLPFLPLDHVFGKGGVKVHDVHAGPDSGSDHLPVFVSFSVAPNR
jgi:endonuclease/exonuclease/phosphatase (EEP) superfamily protein YafD